LKTGIAQLFLILTVVLVFVADGCSTAPRLTPEDRKGDIQFLAQWAKHHSPFVELNEKHKDCPGVESLKPKYVQLAEQAQSNEEFLQVVCGYFNLIGASGHAYLIPKEFLTDYMWQFLLRNPTEISWCQFLEATYWVKLFYSTCVVLPPFPVVHKKDEYFTGDNWHTKELQSLPIQRYSKSME